MPKEIDWSKKHILKVSNETDCLDEVSDNLDKIRQKIEPWLTAVFQSEHLSLLTGNGLTTATSLMADISSPGMSRIKFDSEYKEEISKAADKQATELGRGKANIEDDFRAAIELYKGLLVIDTKKAELLQKDIANKLKIFIDNILKTESSFTKSKKYTDALSYIKSFLISFASRTASRDRLHIVTTNYDRFIEYACDEAGILVLDGFTGKINPVFRTNKISLDYHYNPPGIRGEPRYVEGVIRYTKLHGSLDWSFDQSQINKIPLPFGAEIEHTELKRKPYDQVVIYPNSSKDIETVYFPYAELFREFSTAICQPNSAIVTYGYGFGDSHINRILNDMLTIPSTHIVIISFNDADGRIQEFVKNNNLSQITLLIGDHFGDLKTLVDNYLPKAAIDRITERQHKILEKRGNDDTQGQIDSYEKQGDLSQL